MERAATVGAANLAKRSSRFLTFGFFRCSASAGAWYDVAGLQPSPHTHGSLSPGRLGKPKPVPRIGGVPKLHNLSSS